jgi:hypothetical protein
MRKAYLILAIASIVMLLMTSSVGEQGLLTGLKIVILMGAGGFAFTQYKKRSASQPDEYDFLNPDVQQPNQTVQPQSSDFGVFNEERSGILDQVTPKLSGIAGAITQAISKIKIPKLSLSLLRGEGDLSFLETDTETMGPPQRQETEPEETQNNSQSVEPVPEPPVRQPKRGKAIKETIDPMIKSRKLQAWNVIITPLGILFDKGWVNRFVPWTKFE